MADMDWRAHASKVARLAIDAPFEKKIEAAGLNGARDLQLASWVGIDFRGSTLRGLDFSGADLSDTSFEGASIAGAHFDRAILGRVIHRRDRDPHAPAESSGIARLSKAKDWAVVADPKTWLPSPIPPSDDHLRVGAIFKDAPFAPELVVVPAGDFVMGSSPAEIAQLTECYGKDQAEFFNRQGPQTPVTIPAPFAVGRDAVTRGEFAAFVAATNHKTAGGAYAYKNDRYEMDKDASWENPGFEQDDTHPVICVNHDDAVAYCAWLTKRTGKAYRLLSEAEWEYATRAGTNTAFWWGDTIMPEEANYDHSALYMGGGTKGVWRKSTVPTGSFKANPWGLHNIHGNALEWCHDIWNESHAGHGGTQMQRTAGELNRRVVRSGSWVSNPQYLRAANRARYFSDDRLSNLGFRVGRTLTP